MQRRQKWCRRYINVATGGDVVYPRAALFADGTQLEDTADEQTMSLPAVAFTAPPAPVAIAVCDIPVFWFVYNFDNFFHFLYDTLPYLVHFFDKRITVVNLHLLIPQSWDSLYQFNRELLELADISAADCITVQPNTLYAELFVGSSLTHGKSVSEPPVWCSDIAPDSDATALWARIRGACGSGGSNRLYISRRSWVHGDVSNIGTNYTTRRRCMNEDAVVTLFAAYGFREVFFEQLTTAEKIAVLASASHIAGFIGGGLANVLLACDLQTMAITTPDFMRVNGRFRWALGKAPFIVTDVTEHATYEGEWPLYTRVADIAGRVGEIVGFSGNGVYQVTWSSEGTVAGFHQTKTATEVESVVGDELRPLDGGLNSPFVADLDALEVAIKQFLCER